MDIENRVQMRTNPRILPIKKNSGHLHGKIPESSIAVACFLGKPKTFVFGRFSPHGQDRLQMD